MKNKKILEKELNYSKKEYKNSEITSNKTYHSAIQMIWNS